MIEIETGESESLKEDAPCLHCLIMGFVRSYWMQFGIEDKDSGAVGFDVPLTVAKLAEVMANIILQVEGEAMQEQMIGDAHRVFDGILKAMRTGEEVELSIGGPAVIH